MSDMNNPVQSAELFRFIDRDEISSEKITAPRYSYWRSVFRVFFRKRINIVILTLFALVIAFAYVYPAIIDYDPFVNLLNASSKHLLPRQAMAMFGKNIHWILGAGASGQSTFDAVWFGSRISISMAFICAAINMTVGIIIGSIWGFSKKVDVVMMQVSTSSATCRTSCSSPCWCSSSRPASGPWSSR